MSSSDVSKPYIPKSGLATDGWTKEDEATATCFCAAVQISFPTSKPGLKETFICHCTDCRKITASMFASNFVVDDKYMTHIRGQDKLTSFKQKESIATGNYMTNFFCSTCGTLMYRVSSGFPGLSIMRIGTIDDFHLHETKLKPRVEQFTKDRVSWLHGAEGVKQVRDSAL